MFVKLSEHHVDTNVDLIARAGQKMIPVSTVLCVFDFSYTPPREEANHSALSSCSTESRSYQSHSAAHTGLPYAYKFEETREAAKGSPPGSIGLGKPCSHSVPLSFFGAVMVGAGVEPRASGML